MTAPRPNQRSVPPRYCMGQQTNAGPRAASSCGHGSKLQFFTHSPKSVRTVGEKLFQ